MEDLKNRVFSKEFNDTFNGEQLRDFQKETEIGNKLYCFGLQLQSMKHRRDILAKLEEIDLYLTRIDQADCMLLNWAIQPSMVALVQPRFMKHSCGDVRILVASCLSEIIRITALLYPMLTTSWSRYGNISWTAWMVSMIAKILHLASRLKYWK